MTGTKNVNGKAPAAKAHVVGMALIKANASALLAKETNGDLKSFGRVAEESENERKRRMAPSMAAAAEGSDGHAPLTSRVIADMARLSDSTSNRWLAFGTALLLLPEAKRTTAAVEALEPFTKKITDGPEGLTRGDVLHAAKGLGGDLDAIVAALTKATEQKLHRWTKAQEKRAEEKRIKDEAAAALAKAQSDDATPEEKEALRLANLNAAAVALIAAITGAELDEISSDNWNGIIDAVNAKAAHRKTFRAEAAAKANAAEAAKVTAPKAPGTSTGTKAAARRAKAAAAKAAEAPAEAPATEAPATEAVAS